MAFEILARLGLNTADFSKNFDAATKRAESVAVGWAKRIGASLASAFTAREAFRMIVKSGQMADALGDISERTRMATDDVQEFQTVAAMEGIDFEKVEALAFAIESAAENAASGKKEFADLERVFAQLGISAAAFAQLDPGKQTRALAAGLSKFNEGDQAQILRDLAGNRFGVRMVSTLGGINAGAGAMAVKLEREEIERWSKAMDKAKIAGSNFMKGVAKESAGGRAFMGLMDFLIPDAPQVVGLRADKQYEPMQSMKGASQSKEEVASLQKAYRELQAVIAGNAGPERQRLLITERIAELEEQIKDAKTDAAKIEMETDRQRLLGDLSQLDTAKSAPPPRNYQPQLSSLQRIGAAIENAPSILERRQLEVQMKMERHLSDIKNSGDNFYA